MRRKHGKLHSRYGRAGAPLEILKRLHKGAVKAAATLAKKIRAKGG